MLFCFLFLQGAWTQQMTVNGKVTDSENAEAVIGANITIKGSTSGVITDLDGNYSINTKKGDVLVFSYIGYKTQEVSVETQTVIDVSLEADISELDEIVVVGYGTQKKSDLTGAVASISAERLSEKPNTNFRQALQGSIPGVVVNINSAGAEQNDISLIIRGRNSITASNSPLIIYDGVPYAGSISDINPNDIKSINVLKDASSTAIYGSRGSNGVIIIETKKGTSSKPTISYSTYVGINEIANIPEVYDGPGFAKFKEEREPGEITPSEMDVLEAGTAVDWLDLATRSALKQEHNLSVAGAAKNMNYYVSLGYQDVEGVAINDDFERITLRANLTFDINDYIKFGTSTQLSRIDRSGLAPSFGSEAAGAFFTNPLTTAFDENGDLTLFPWPEEEFFTNPLAPTLAINDDLSRKVFTANYLEFRIPFIQGLSYKLNTGIEYSDRDARTYWGRNTARGANVNGEAIVSNTVEENYLIEHILNYRKTFGNHTLEFTGLYSAQQIKFERHTTTGKDFPNDLLTYFQINLARLPKEADQVFDQETLISQMGRLNYNFKGKYFANFTVRRDGYTGFGDNNKYGVFPSVGLGWTISKEPFFPKNGLINTLKLRLTYGENGNQAIGSVDNLARLNELSYLEGETTAPGFIPSRLANNNLSWESTATFNLGVDLGLLDDRFQINLNAYKTNNKDLLLEKLIPSVHGIRRIIDNVAETENQGIELNISGYIVNKRDFKWSANANFTYNQNKIIALQGGGRDDVANNLFIGQPISANYGLQFDGIWQEEDDIASSAQPDAVPGDVRVRDISNPLDDNGNPIIGISANDDRIIQGQRDPITIWGITNTFTYKNFSLNVLVHGVGGVIKRNTLRDVNVFGGVKRNWYVLDFWTPENRSNTFYRNGLDANPFGVRFYEDADFVRVKDITLAYQFRQSNFNLKLYFTGRNLFTFTSWEGLDPELNSQRAIPLQKEYVFGLNFTL